MAQRLIEQSCKRFRHEISDEDDNLIRTTSLDDARVAIKQIETQLAARQSLRNLDRLTPYLNAVERYSKAIDPLCNGVPFLPYIWAPVKFILIAVYEHTQILDKILSAYAQIGASLPRLSRLGDNFPNDRAFQQLLAFQYEDIMEFHRKAYALIRKPAWKIFFSSAWGQFERRFGDIIESITRSSDLIDKEAASIDIIHAKEWRLKALEESNVREQRWETQQAQAVMKWLETSDNDQELKFEWLRQRCCPGTGSWIIKNKKFRSWLQRGRGNPVMWLYGKPGSGKSVLASQIIAFLRSKTDTRVLFFFCDYQSPPYEIAARIFTAFATQVIGFAPEIVPFFYDEYLTKGRRPLASVLKGALAKFLAEFNDVRLVVDGIDELPAGEHKTLINELIQLATASNHSCKLLISSQDLPSIRPLLSKRLALFLRDEKNAIEKDVQFIVSHALGNLNQHVGITIGPSLLEELQNKILQKSEGMLLWVCLVLSLLESSANIAELRENVDSLPNDLETLYGKILNNIQARCLPSNLARVRRIFGWLIFSKRGRGIMKHEVLIGTSLHEGSDSLNRDNRPFSTALEICKPFIEDGPGGTVAIIHSTLSQYLLSIPSGPFISTLTAHQDIAFACISQLIQILDYVRSDIPHPELMTRTGLGIFGLQSYANEHWIEHFLQIFEDSAPLSSVAQASVVRQALQLCAKHSHLIQSLDTEALVHFQEDISIGLHLRLDRLDSMPELQRLIYQVLNFRKTLEDQQTKSGLDVRALDLDRTLFSRADANYQRDVQHLSQIDFHQGLCQQELLAFRADYGPTAFTCPIRSCQRFQFGYGSAAKLEDHKKARHGKVLKCCVEGCPYNDVGYASPRSLREHQRRYHGNPELRRVPNFISRPVRNDSQISSTQSAGQDGQQAQLNAQLQQETAAPQQPLQNSQGAQPEQQAMNRTNPQFIAQMAAQQRVIAQQQQPQQMAAMQNGVANGNMNGQAMSPQQQQQMMQMMQRQMMLQQQQQQQQQHQQQQQQGGMMNQQQQLAQQYTQQLQSMQGSQMRQMTPQMQAQLRQQMAARMNQMGGHMGNPMQRQVSGQMMNGNNINIQALAAMQQQQQQQQVQQQQPQQPHNMPYMAPPQANSPGYNQTFVPPPYHQQSHITTNNALPPANGTLTNGITDTNLADFTQDSNSGDIDAQGSPADGSLFGGSDAGSLFGETAGDQPFGHEVKAWDLVDMKR